jgi:hypothetical protein
MVSGREPVRRRTCRRSRTGPVAVAVLALALSGGCTTERPSAATPPPAPEAPLPTVHYSFGTQPLPWTKPLNVLGGADAAGLATGPVEGTARRFESHLDIFVNGRPVPVTAGLGVDGSPSPRSAPAAKAFWSSRLPRFPPVRKYARGAYRILR